MHSPYAPAHIRIPVYIYISEDLVTTVVDAPRYGDSYLQGMVAAPLLLLDTPPVVYLLLMMQEFQNRTASVKVKRQGEKLTIQAPLIDKVVFGRLSASFSCSRSICSSWGGPN